MISNNNLDTANKLIESNPDIKAVFDHISDDYEQLISRFTHELRNPLTLVRSTIQLIESQHPEVADYKYWNQLISDIDVTVDILNELSLYNHCENLQYSDIDLVELLNHTVDSMKPLALDKNVTLNLSMDDNTLIYQTYSCDPVKIRQAMTNLLKNAVEAAKIDTTINISLYITPITTNSTQYINLSISDSGVPISPENLDRIFEPFVTTKANGTGLGLAISQKIAKLHKGGLSVSQTDSTVTFTLQLPVDVTADVSLLAAL